MRFGKGYVETVIVVVVVVVVGSDCRIWVMSDVGFEGEKRKEEK